jgi:hypothetical protein
LDKLNLSKHKRSISFFTCFTNRRTESNVFVFDVSCFYALLNAVHGILLLPSKQTTGGVALEP